MPPIILSTTPIDSFTWKWPDNTLESYDSGWDVVVEYLGRQFRVRHGLGHRHAFGRARRRAVTWIGGAPIVEGVGADDYPTSRALLSMLRRPDQRHLQDLGDVPPGYEDFTFVRQRDEIDAPYSRYGLAVKVAEDDVASWVTHALLRYAQRWPWTPAPAAAINTTNQPDSSPAPILPLPAAEPTADDAAASSALTAAQRDAIVQALLAYGAQQAKPPPGQPTAFTPNPAANALVTEDPFAFLLAVIFDQGVVAERAWEAPFLLRERLGHLEPARLAVEHAAIAAAVDKPPKLHRYVNTLPGWIAAAAARVCKQYGGDARSIWSDTPTAGDLQKRFQAFRGIGPKKAAMAVEILARDLGVPIRAPETGDIAYDVHIRRVFLRTRLADIDDLEHMLARAREAHPAHPAALDFPAWLIGRTWCRPATPNCKDCPLTACCPKDVARAAGVIGS